MSVRNAIYCYDLEGPISDQDHAFVACKRFVPDGDRLFSVLSRYDDILALTNKEGYEPGDTLRLLVPFFAEAGVTREDLEMVSAEAGLVPGICELFVELQQEGYLVWIISTSYEQHAFSIAQRVGVPIRQVHCTRFLPANMEERNRDCTRLARERAVELFHEELESGINDELIRELLDLFFWKQLNWGEMAEVRVMGGRRKVIALKEAVRKSGGYLDNAFIVVDSITDFRMAQAVEAAGGVALVWNGNQYIIPYASCGVAAVDAKSVKPLFQAWQKGGRPAVREIVEAMPNPKNLEVGPYYHWLAGKDSEFHQEVLSVHKRLRIVCRGAEIARLG